MQTATLAQSNRALITMATAISQETISQMILQVGIFFFSAGGSCVNLCLPYSVPGLWGACSNNDKKPPQNFITAAAKS